MPQLSKAKSIDIDNFRQRDGAVGDGITTSYVLTNTPKAGSLDVFVNGLLDNDYTLTVSTKTVLFNSAPTNLQDIVFSYWKV